MKIIQSFAQFEEGSPYLDSQRKSEYVYLSFYVFLLSQATIRKHVGPITMFCNQQAYNSFFKYIPYNNIVIMENKNPFLMWAKYKIDVMKTIGDDFIHVDSDIMVDRNIFTPFINGECDVLIQDVVPFKKNLIKSFGFENKDFLAETLILTKPYDGRCFSCGTLGINKSSQEYYFAGIDVLYDAMVKVGIENVDMPTLLLEEQLLYYIAIENNFNFKTIIPDELIAKYGILEGGAEVGYRHFWALHKYRKIFIDYIRKRLFYEFPTHYSILLRYEHEVLSKFEFFKHMGFPKVYS